MFIWILCGEFFSSCVKCLGFICCEVECCCVFVYCVGVLVEDEFLLYVWFKEIEFLCVCVIFWFGVIFLLFGKVEVKWMFFVMVWFGCCCCFVNWLWNVVDFWLVYGNIWFKELKFWFVDWFNLICWGICFRIFEEGFVVFFLF